jgi:hypothetical protein
MLCCAGLIGGMVVGQYLGGPWTVIAPAAGFGIGLAADMRFMKRCHMSQRAPHEARPPSKPDTNKPDQPAGKRQEAELVHH